MTCTPSLKPQSDRPARGTEIWPIALYGFSPRLRPFVPAFCVKSDRNIDAHGRETDWCCDSNRLTIGVSYMSCTSRQTLHTVPGAKAEEFIEKIEAD
ncbi:hypothetical protein KCP78_03860 [Salmonella enterica subsp. enterica]|nr:hypothetical protein KCP78_03860 [Salmonella enterica subsp. enterica]